MALTEATPEALVALGREEVNVADLLPQPKQRRRRA
jgi:hypothetical protein